MLLNVLGIIQDIKKIAAIVHSVGAVLVVDGAQAVHICH
jgi:selenocysteine lyase/cysteine desulfurase